MTVLKTILTVIFIIVCIALAVIILLQESKSSGLGAISGAADTYWGKNKGRSMEGKLEKGTRVLVVLFFLAAILLNIPSITDPGSAKSSNTNTTVNDTNVTSNSGVQTDNTTDGASEDDGATDGTSENDSTTDGSDEAASGEATE